MKPPLLSPNQLAGIHEKLKRADESIHDLNSQIVAFLRERPEGGLSHDKQKAAKEFAEFYAKRVIPLQFGVIAGEVIHHLRSSLEHIAWMLSSQAYRNAHPRWIGFPIIATKPPTKDEIASYNRQVKGIVDNGALALIERLQPYKAPNPADDPLAILHDLSNEDKHHTLILIVSQWSAALTLPPLGTFTISGFDTQHHEWALPASAKNPKLEFAPYIAFAQIGRWKGEAVIPVLTRLLNAVQDDVKRFSELTI